MSSEMENIEQRLKSFVGQLQTESGIYERIVYKHKNQHRRCPYFQYILKVRRDLKLLKSANVEDIFDASFLVVNGNRPKQKVQLLESLKRRRRGTEKFNFLERLLGVTRLLSQMVEPLLKAAMEISTLLARSFFMKFSVTTLAVLARIRVLVQQMLLDAVLLYNTVSSISQSEQIVKLNQEGFEVFREYYPTKEDDSLMLECVWQMDKYVLIEKKRKFFETSPAGTDVSLNVSKIQYENVDVLLGVDDSGTVTEHHSQLNVINVEENVDSSEMKFDEHVQNASNTGKPESETADLSQDVLTNSSVGIIFENKDNNSIEDSSCIIEAGPPTSSIESSRSCPVKLKTETKKRVAFISVKRPTPSTTNESSPFDLKGVEKNDDDKDDPFFDLLTGGSKKIRLF